MSGSNFNITTNRAADEAGTVTPGATPAKSRTTATDSIQTNGEDIIAITGGTFPKTVTLATADVIAGKQITVKDEAGTVTLNRDITIATQGAETIDGAASVVITADYGQITLYSDGSNWFTLPGSNFNTTDNEAVASSAGLQRHQTDDITPAVGQTGSADAPTWSAVPNFGLTGGAISWSKTGTYKFKLFVSGLRAQTIGRHEVQFRGTMQSQSTPTVTFPKMSFYVDTINQHQASYVGEGFGSITAGFRDMTLQFTTHVRAGSQGVEIDQNTIFSMHIEKVL